MAFQRHLVRDLNREFTFPHAPMTDSLSLRAHENEARWRRDVAVTLQPVVTEMASLAAVKPECRRPQLLLVLRRQNLQEALYILVKNTVHTEEGTTMPAQDLIARYNREFSAINEFVHPEHGTSEFAEQRLLSVFSEKILHQMAYLWERAVTPCWSG